MRATIAPTLLLCILLSQIAFAQGRGFRFNQENVPGWTFMTVEERDAHRESMLGLKTYDECKVYMERFRAKMEARAKEQGKTLRQPRVFACDQLKARGAIK